MSALNHPIHHCGIVGAGNSAHALACYLIQQGHRATLYARRPEALQHLKDQQTIRAKGKIEGQFRIDGVCHQPQQLAECDVLFLCTTATAYSDVIDQLHPFLHAGQKIVLFSSKLAGSQEVSERLRQLGKKGIAVVETDALFACRLQPDRSIWVRGLKQWNLFCTPRRQDTDQCQPWLQALFPGLEPAQNLIQRGLTDFGALTHALTVVLNANPIDRQESFLFYYEGFTERTVVILEQLEAEFQSLAQAFGTTLLPARELLRRYYGCETSSLLAAMRSVPNYRHSLAPDNLQTRYLSEDVACTLVPAQQLARLAGLSTPILDAVVALATALNGIDYGRQGRTLDKLGWGDYGAEEIRTILNR